MREIKEHLTGDGMRYRVRYRLNGTQTSETFVRRADAEMFRDILGNGRGDRVRQALAWLEQRRANEVNTDLTFGRWFDDYVTQLTGVTPRTRSDYHSLRRRYFTDLDAVPLAMLNRTHVTTIVNSMDAAGRSPKTIKQAIHTLSTCLALAVDEGHLPANPARRVRLPSLTLNEVKPRFLTEDEAADLLDAVGDYYRPFVTVLLGTGLRFAEATALEARHVNLRAGTVRVEQSWKRVPGQGLVLGPPKSAKGRRTVNAAVPVLVALQPLLGKPKDLVFTTPSGGKISHSNFYNNTWRPACERVFTDPPRIHDTRHTHASWLLSAGISLEAVQDQLGHESIDTTRKVYAHLLPAVGVAVGREASAAMERVLALRAAHQELA